MGKSADNGPSERCKPSLPKLKPRKKHAGRKEQPKKGKDKEKTPEVDDEFDWRLAKANGEPPRYRGTWHCLSLQGCASVGKDYSQQLRAKVAQADKKKRAE